MHNFQTKHLINFYQTVNLAIDKQGLIYFVFLSDVYPASQISLQSFMNHITTFF